MSSQNTGKETSRKNNCIKWKRLCSNDCCSNKYHLLRIFSLFIALLLVIVSFLYSFAAIYDLTLSQIWCNNGNQRSWDEVVLHNAGVPNSHGEGGCWRSSTLPFTDDIKLFATINGGFEAATISPEPFNIIKMLLYTSVFLCLSCLLIGYSYQTVVDCKKTLNDEW